MTNLRMCDPCPGHEGDLGRHELMKLKPHEIVELKAHNIAEVLGWEHATAHVRAVVDPLFGWRVLVVERTDG